jgi:hypothetical protein
MKRECPLPCSQDPAIGPCPEKDESIPHLHILFLGLIWSLSFGFPDQNLSDLLIRSVCLTHLVLLVLMHTTLTCLNTLSVWNNI